MKELLNKEEFRHIFKETLKEFNYKGSELDPTAMESFFAENGKPFMSTVRYSVYSNIFQVLKRIFDSNNQMKKLLTEALRNAGYDRQLETPEDFYEAVLVRWN